MVEELARHGYRISPEPSTPCCTASKRRGTCARTSCATAIAAQGLSRHALGPTRPPGSRRQGARVVSRTHGRQVANVWKHYRLELMALAAGAFAAQPAPPPAALTIAQAVQNALHNYPSIQSLRNRSWPPRPAYAWRERLPARVDALAQVNRATRNNVSGCCCAKHAPIHVRPGDRFE